MNLSNYKKAVIINEICIPNDLKTSFKYTVINVFKHEDLLSLYTLKKPKLDLKFYKPSKKDKLYFYPGCDVPRYKVRIWGKNKNVSITNDINKASHAIAGVNTIKTFINYHSSCLSENAQVYCNWLDQNYPVSVEITELKNIIESIGNEHVYFNRSMYNYNNYYSAGLGSSPRNQKAEDYGFTSLTGQLAGSTFQSWCTLNYITNSNLIDLNNIFDLTSKVYSENSIIEIVNENSAIIDKEMFEQIKNMFESKNKADHLVALSIMSNCNVKPSLHFLLLLLQEFSNVILSLKEHKHINFKSLLKYLALPRWDKLNSDEIIQCLMDKEELTMKILKEVVESVKETMQKRFNTGHFKINSLTVSDEVKEHMLKKLEITK